MRRTLLFLLLVSFLIRCTTPEVSPEMEQFIRQFAGKNIDEIKEEVQKELANFSNLMPLMTSDLSEFQKNTAKIDEKYIAPFAVDTSLVTQALTQFESITFEQRFEQNESLLTFAKKDVRYWSSMRLPEEMHEHLQATAVFYRDEAPLRDSLPYMVNFSRGRRWGKMAVIDSVQVQYTLRYPSRVDSLSLRIDDTEVTYQGQQITLQGHKDNFIHLKVPNSLNDKLVVYGFNEEGRPLAIQAATQRERAPEDQMEAIRQMQQFYEEFHGKLQDHSLSDTLALMSYLRRRVPELTGIQTSTHTHRMLYFRGNVSRVVLYFITKRKQKITEFTAVRSTQFGNVIHMPTAKGNVFLSAKLVPLFTVDSVRVKQLEERYFYGDNQYYFLDVPGQQLIPVDAEELVEFKNGLAVLRKKKGDPFLLFNANNQQLSAKKISRYEAISDQLIAIYDELNRVYLVNKAGDLKVLPNVQQINPMREGRILVQNTDEHYGFLDETGQVVIPFEYDSATDFSEGLTAVKKGGERRYGYIGKNAEAVLPYRYVRASNFIHGLAFVSTTDSLFLISPQGIPKVKAPMQTWGISGRGINRVYQLGDSFYNARGERISKND